MLTFLVCLLPIVARASVPTSENYILDISIYNTLKNVRFISDPDPVLNLSGRNIQWLKRTAFNNVPDVESLDISNNSLTILSEHIFSNLTKLKILSLANNKIWKLRDTFVGLDNLQLLDISRNPIRHLTRCSLFGLPGSVRILTEENNIESFSIDTYSDLFFTKEELVSMKWQPSTVEDDIQKEFNTALESIDYMPAIPHLYVTGLDKYARVNLSPLNGNMMLLKPFWKNEKKKLTEKWVQVPINVSIWHIDLHDLNITGFWEYWYELDIIPINSLSFSNNRIAEIKKETLNYLSAGLTYVNFQNNQIRKIRSWVVQNYHLIQLNFKNNLVEKIEDNAFAITKLHGLDLSKNQLKSLNFVSTLPNTMTKFSASRNRITSIPNNAFSRLSHLSYLNLLENKIETLQNDVFQNLTSLQTLILAKNSIKTIEQGAFKGLTALNVLYLQNNFIRNLQANTFTELTALETLDLSTNNIKTPLIDFPQTLNVLNLNFNKINALKKHSFFIVPRIALTLIGNNISRIARGAFNLPTLNKLFLDKNILTTFKCNSYEGLRNLKYLWLSQNQISNIRKNSCKNLKNLKILSISSNPLQKLKVGAFYGFKKNTMVDIYDNNLKEMPAGLFNVTKNAHSSIRCLSDIDL